MSGKSIFEKSARRFFITLNDVTKYEELKKYVTAKKNFKAMASCLAKAPTTGHEHIHMAVWFKRPFKWKQQVGEMIEEMKSECGSLEYVSPEKQEGWQKYLDMINIDKVRKTKRTCAEILKMTPSEAKKELTLGQMCSYYKLQLYDEPITTEEMYKPDVQVYYFWGDSGVGKSRMVYDKIIELGYGKEITDRVKYTEPFWFGQIYRKTPVVWYEEFRDYKIKASDFVAFIDYYVNPMRVIGGSIMNKYKYIFITTTQDPLTIYENSKEPIQQWVRRMKVKHVVSLESN